MTELDYDTEEVRRMKQWLIAQRESDEYGFGEFEIVPGVTVNFDWSLDYDEPTLPVTILVYGDGLNLFTRGTENTLTETGALGHGPNYGEEISYLVEEWIRENFVGQEHPMEFEYSDQEAPNLWLFTAWIENPNGSWEGY